MNSFCTEEFWKMLNALPPDVRLCAYEAYELWRADQGARGLRFKKLANQKQNIWSVRIGAGHRALCVRDGSDCIWYWIGAHAEYDKLV